LFERVRVNNLRVLKGISFVAAMGEDGVMYLPRTATKNVLQSLEAVEWYGPVWSDCNWALVKKAAHPKAHRTESGLKS